MSKDKQEFIPKGEETIREEVVKDFGLNLDEQKELVDKITSERVEAQKKLSKAIEQKIKIREGKDFYKAKANLEDKTGEKKKAENLKTEIDTSKFVTKEEFEKKELRNKHSYLNDEEFSFIDAYAKGSGKKFEECLSDPIIKGHLETNEANNRIAGATKSPSTRFKSSAESRENKVAKEFDRDYPVGFVSKKN